DGRNWGAEAGAGLGRCGAVLSAAFGAGADRHGSHGQLSLAGGFAQRTGSRVVGGRCGPDSCQLCAAAEDGQAGRGAHPEAAGGRTVSAHLDAVFGGARSAATAAASSQTGDHSGTGEERIATSVSESGSAAQTQAVESSRTAGAARVAVEAVGRTSQRGLTAINGHAGPADRTAGPGGKSRSSARQNGAASSNPTRSRSDHCVGLCADHGRRQPLSPRQAGSQLPGPDSARALFGRTAEAGSDHQARQSHDENAAGGSGAECGASGSAISQKVFAS